jgi:hypothetical protein
MPQCGPRSREICGCDQTLDEPSSYRRFELVLTIPLGMYEVMAVNAQCYRVSQKPSQISDWGLKR